MKLTLTQQPQNPSKARLYEASWHQAQFSALMLAKQYYHVQLAPLIAEKLHLALKCVSVKIINACKELKMNGIKV